VTQKRTIGLKGLFAKKVCERPLPLARLSPFARGRLAGSFMKQSRQGLTRLQRGTAAQRQGVADPLCCGRLFVSFVQDEIG
jgi:hypothetical protein